jgi:hypothetical protein
MVQQVRERINKWDYMKFKNFCTAKEMVSKLKPFLPTEREKICQLYIKETDNPNIQRAQKSKLPQNK